MKFAYIFSTHVITLCTRFDICSSGKVNSSERYPNRVVSFGLNIAYMKIRTPNSCCTDNTWFFEYFYGFLGFVDWEISGHFGGVYQSRYCASGGAFLFFCICNVSKYCFLFVWKANKVEVGEDDVFMNDFHLCTLKTAWSQWVPYQDP